MNKPGCISRSQMRAVKAVLEDMVEDPFLLCDLEGCGPVGGFEQRFAEVCGVEYALAVSSGTAAIHAALLALGVGPGDEVISSPYSWPQTVSPVLFTGATLVFADIDARTLHLDPVSVADRMTPRTKAIIVPHLFGHMAEMPSLGLWARSVGVPLVSDVAQAMGAELYGRPVGPWGDLACFSLGRGKLVSCGEGGVLVTNNQILYERAVALTQHPDRFWRLTGEQGHGLALNYRLHPLQAALGLAALEDKDRILAHRRKVKAAFLEALLDNELLTAPASISGDDSAAYGIPLIWNGAGDRGLLCDQAQGLGLPLRPGPVGEPLHLRLAELIYPSPVDHWTHQEGSCPVAEKHCRHRELWALSALDMDGVSEGEAYDMARALHALVNWPQADRLCVLPKACRGEARNVYSM